MKTPFDIEDFCLGHGEASAFVAVSCPVLSWRLSGSRQGLMQSAWRLQATSNGGEMIWETDWIRSSSSAEILWGGRPLKSREAGHIRLWVQDDENHVAEAALSFEVSLLSNSDWHAKWIAFSGNNPSHYAPIPYFRRKFRLASSPVKARLYVTARGLFEAHLNGQHIGKDHFTPVWTDYAQQIQFLTYDVTELLSQGENVLGALAGDGWYCGYLSGRRRNLYGKRPELLMQLELTLQNGRQVRLVTDSSWRCATGPILHSDIYDGEFYDVRLELNGWDTPEYHPGKNWRSAEVTGKANVQKPALLPISCPPVRKIAEIEAVKLLHPRPDTWIWDFGQNITGNVRIRIGGSNDALYTLRYGEMLYDDGTLYTLNYRSAISTDRVNIQAEKECVYEPTFTFHGFRYVQIDGFQFTRYPVENVQVVACVYASDLKETGAFRCSNAKLQQLYSNIKWGQIGNFLGIPTDCPQRDERLGWTGDAQIFVGTACCNLDSQLFFAKYMRDLRDAQQSNGSVPAIVPDTLNNPRITGAAAWADAAVIIPWIIYQRYADTSILRDNYRAMKKWVEYQRRTSNELIRQKTAFGDWLAFSDVETPSEFIGTCYFRKGTWILAQAAALLGHKADALKYRRLTQDIEIAFSRRFVSPEGLIAVRSQTAFALALRFDLLPEEHRAQNAEVLAQMVRENGNRLSTGFVGTGNINFALSENGQEKSACDLYLQEAFPSWLFSVNQGATTMWERWNSYTKTEGFGDVNMNSFNHYSLGAVYEWVVAEVAGIHFTEPGGKSLRFQCIPDARIGELACRLKTPYGEVTSHWKLTGSDRLRWQINTPPNTTCQILPPRGWCGNTAAHGYSNGHFVFEFHPVNQQNGNKESNEICTAEKAGKSGTLAEMAALCQ